MPPSEPFQFLLDLLFPIRCIGCSAAGAYACPACLKRIGRQPSGNQDEIIAAAPLLENSLLSKFIHAFKYDGVRDIGPALATLLPVLNLPRPSLLIPVPLHWRRENIRGFNQSAVLAQAMAEKFGVPAAARLLKRHRFTRPQAELPRAKRLTNLRGAFEATDPRLRLDPSITYWLVDDVATTGATFSACREALCRRGANDVRGLVIGRTV